MEKLIFSLLSPFVAFILFSFFTSHPALADTHCSATATPVSIQDGVVTQVNVTVVNDQYANLHDVYFGSDTPHTFYPTNPIDSLGSNNYTWNGFQQDQYTVGFRNAILYAFGDNTHTFTFSIVNITPGVSPVIEVSSEWWSDGCSVTVPVVSPTPTPTPTPTPVIQINANPSTATVTVGSPFTVSVMVNSTGQSFNAAQSTVSVSSNLSVTGIKSPSSNSCNFDFTKSPTTSNPSFAGGIYGTSSTGCTAYTMVLTPTSVGTGTITFTNGSVKAYADSSEIITGVQNGSFTINPAPTPTGATTQTIDDSVQGTGQNQWNYVGSGWGHCTSCNDTATFYNASQSWDNNTNDYVTMQFTGVQFNLYGTTDPRDGIGAVSIDGGPETNLDFYSATRTGNVLLWTSPIISNSIHTVKLRVTGTHNTNATDNYLILDRGDILVTGVLPNLSVNTYPTDTYNSSLTITGTKDSSITTVFVNGSSSNVTYPTSTTWQASISLPTLGNNTFAVYGADSQNNQTATTSIIINKHTLGDINGDGVVDLIDASLFAVDFGKTNPSTFVYPLSDMNADGQVDLTDLSILAKLEQ